MEGLRSASLLFLTRSLNYGGCERQLVALAKGLHHRGQALAVATFYPEGALRRELLEAHVPTVALEKRSRWDALGFLFRLVRLVRSIRPAVLHTYLGSANVLGVLLKLVLPSMKIVWGVRASNMDLSRYGRLDRILFWVERRLSPYADVIIANSHAGLSYGTSQGFPQEKIVVIPNGIDTERFSPRPDFSITIRQNWDIPADTAVIGLIGRLDPMKGHRVFLNAAALLLRSHTRVHFVCVGDGPPAMATELSELAIGLGIHRHVTWAKSASAVEHVYGAMDIVTSCSTYGEGFSNVIGEAMACERICVATDVGDAKRILGNSGYVVPAGDAAALATAWLQALNLSDDERRIRGRAARERIVKHFALDRMITETALVLEKLQPRESR
jgi:glycosyltransferase involved in cell wall biosynthesis